MTKESSYETYYLLPIAMFALPVTISEIFSRNVHHLNLENGPMSIINMLTTMLDTTSYVLALAMFAPSVTVCEMNFPILKK